MTLINFRKFLKLYTMKIWNFSDVNFSKLIFLTNILYLNDFDKFSKIFKTLYYENMEFFKCQFFKIDFSDKYFVSE